MRFPGKNTGVGCHFLLQGIFPTQRSNPRLLYWQVCSLPVSYLGSPHREYSLSKSYVAPMLGHRVMPQTSHLEKQAQKQAHWLSSG